MLIGPLSTTLSTRDMYDLIEIVMVDQFNDRVMARRRKQQREANR